MALAPTLPGGRPGKKNTHIEISAPTKKGRNFGSGVPFSESARSVFTLRVRNNGVRPKEASYDQKIFTRLNSGPRPCYSSPRRDWERRGPNESFWDPFSGMDPTTDPLTRLPGSSHPGNRTSRLNLDARAVPEALVRSPALQIAPRTRITGSRGRIRTREDFLVVTHLFWPNSVIPYP